MVFGLHETGQEEHGHIKGRSKNAHITGQSVCHEIGVARSHNTDGQEKPGSSVWGAECEGKRANGRPRWMYKNQEAEDFTRGSLSRVEALDPTVLKTKDSWTVY